MPKNDSIDKVVTSYFQALTKQPFTYKGKAYQPQRLVVSPLLFRGATCPPNCGGCCASRFTLDYLPIEPKPKECQPRHVTFNGEQYRIFSIVQEQGGRHCTKLNLDNGRCTIHGFHPFTCDFELIRSLISGNDKRATFLTSKLYGRGWAMMRIDGERGALCEMLPADEQHKNEVVRKLKRLRQWINHFRLDTHIDAIIEWAETGPHLKPLVLEAPCLSSPSVTEPSADFPAASDSGEPIATADTSTDMHW